MLASGQDHNSVTVNDKGIIVIVVRGAQNRETVRQMREDVAEAIHELRAAGKKVLVFTDISHINPRDVTSGARQEGRTLMTNFKVDRAAICGRGAWATFMMYLLRVTRAGSQFRFFTDKRRAVKWLESDKPEKRRSLVGLIVGSVILLIGATAFLGWHYDNPTFMSWFPSLRPMSPLAALGLVVGGLGFIFYWAGKPEVLRWLAGGGLLLGVAALLPLPIDTLFFSEKVASRGVFAELADSAAICFIAMGVAGLIARRTWWWVRPLEFAAVAVVIGLALFSVFAQAYARDWLYETLPHFAMAFNLAVAFVFAGTGLLLLTIYRKTGSNVLTQISRTGWLIVIVLVFVQVATYGSWVQTNERQKDARTAAFMTSAREVESSIEARLTAYNNALYGFQGLFLASDGVNQGEFETYYTTSNIAKNYPGFRAISLISKVKDKDVAAFVQKQRTDKSLHAQGNPTFAITQRANVEDHYIVTFVAASNTVGGSDLASNPSRKLAFEHAEKLGAPVASGTVEFAASATAPAAKGFFITVPVANNNKPENVIGFVNAVFNYADFFGDTLTSSVMDEKFRVTIVDVTDGTEVYRSDKTEGQKIVHSYEKQLAVADRVWQLHVEAGVNFAGSTDRLSGVVLSAGLLLSMLLIVIFWIQARGRVQALKLAESITIDLQEERNRAVTNDQKSSAILSSIGDGVFAVDMQGRITVFNAIAQAISGVSESDAIGKYYGDVLRFEYEKTGKINDTFIKKALDGHMASMSNHTVIVRGDGVRVPVADSAAPIRDAADTMMGAIVVFRDVSKEYELDKAKTEFVSLASHQLRTPLSAINWYGEMLLGGDAGKLTKDQHEYIKEIFEGSQRMVELVNSLLDVSRLEVGKLPNQPAPTSLQQLVENMEKELKVSVKEKALRLTADLKNIPAVIADPKQLRIIVQNLMSNAVKYTDTKGNVHVTLRKATEKDIKAAKLKAGNYWYFSVADDGYGIPVSEQPKIFGKLFRADNVRKLDVEGTGLGLYIIKEIVDKMEGRVWFESVEGKGTTFYVVAPMEPGHRK